MSLRHDAAHSAGNTACIVTPTRTMPRAQRSILQSIPVSLSTPFSIVAETSFQLQRALNPRFDNDPDCKAALGPRRFRLPNRRVDHWRGGAVVVKVLMSASLNRRLSAFDNQQISDRESR
jgi:hypothetical protein